VHIRKQLIAGQAYGNWYYGNWYYKPNTVFKLINKLDRPV